jgi:hypothetical protein
MLTVRQRAHNFHLESLENDARGWGLGARDIGYLFSQGTKLLQGHKSWLYHSNRKISVSSFDGAAPCGKRGDGLVKDRDFETKQQVQLTLFFYIVYIYCSPIRSMHKLCQV